MSSQITTPMVQQFSANVFHLTQQKGSRLRGLVRNESQNGKSKFFERIGKAVSQRRTSRHGDTPQLDTPHSRRMVTLVDFECGDMVDDQDKIRLLISPESEYAKAFAWALGRDIDDMILDQGSGNAHSGEDGSTLVALPSTQKIASVASTAGAKLNVQALRRAKKIFDTNDIDPSTPRHIAHNANQIENLLTETEATSADFNTIRTLVMGQINTFLGFNFVHTEQINTQGAALSFDTTTGAVGSGGGDANTYQKCLAWAQDGIILSLGQDVTGRIAEDPGKSFNTRVYAKMSIGGERLEEEKVVEILCKA